MKPIFFILAVFISSFLNAQQPAVIQAEAETDLIPEGIAIDNRTGTIYITSINRHKIIAVDQQGAAKDFITAGQDGFLEGLGLKVDEKRGWLWALSVLREGKQFSSRIHAFDLATAKTVQQYGIQDTVPHLFNDLAIDNNGNIFLTDTYFSAVYKLEPERKVLSLFLQSPGLRYPNGLVFGKGHLYIATYRNGLVRLDTATKKLEKMSGIKDTVISHGLDGLVYRDGSLYGVYNIGKERADDCVIRYHLTEDGTGVQSETLLSKGHPAMEDPTTAALYKNKLYVLANSHLDAYNANQTSVIGIENKLKKPLILVVPLQ
jgi:sugar lactone lactonase YvrE